MSDKAEEVRAFLTNARETMEKYPLQERDWIAKKFDKCSWKQSSAPYVADTIGGVMQHLTSWAEVAANDPTFTHFQDLVYVDKWGSEMSFMAGLKTGSYPYLRPFEVYQSTEGWFFWYV